MERRFKKTLSLILVLIFFFFDFSLLFAAQESEQPEEVSGVTSLETMENLTQRFQSLSAGLNQIPNPPKLAGGTIQLPAVRSTEKARQAKRSHQ